MRQAASYRSIFHQNTNLAPICRWRGKMKFTCPECGQNAWGKPDTQLICGACYEDGEGEICLMLAEPSDEAA
jgi:hypothetical protein